MSCGYKVRILCTGEVLECVMDDHPGASIHSTETTEFRKVGEGLFVVRRFADGLRPRHAGQEI